VLSKADLSDNGITAFCHLLRLRRCFYLHTLTMLIIGNAPTLLSLAQLQKMAPTWMNTSMAIFGDQQANKVTILFFVVALYETEYSAS